MNATDRFNSMTGLVYHMCRKYAMSLAQNGVAHEDAKRELYGKILTPAEYEREIRRITDKLKL